jgi:5'-nucleotidase
MKKERVILMDMDGTTMDLYSAIRERMKSMFGKELIMHEKLTDYHIERVHPREYEDMIYQVLISEGLFRECLPITGAYDAVMNLSKLGRVVFCSMPMKGNPTCIEDKLWSIEKYFGKQFTTEVHLVEDKTRVHGDILIDDKPVITGQSTPTWEHVLHTMPYNRHIQNKRRLTWKDYQNVLGIK